MILLNSSQVDLLVDPNTSNSTVVLFAGMFVVGAAMFYTGLAQAIGEKVVPIQLI